MKALNFNVLKLLLMSNIALIWLNHIGDRQALHEGPGEYVLTFYFWGPCIDFLDIKSSDRNRMDDFEFFKSHFSQVLIREPPVDGWLSSHIDDAYSGAYSNVTCLLKLTCQNLLENRLIVPQNHVQAHSSATQNRRIVVEHSTPLLGKPAGSSKF